MRRQLGGTAPSLWSAQAGELRVQDRRDRVEPRLVELRIGLRALESHALEPSLNDVAIAQDEDCQPRAIRQLDELEMSDTWPASHEPG